MNTIRAEQDWSRRTFDALESVDWPRIGRRVGVATLGSVMLLSPLAEESNVTEDTPYYLPAACSPDLVDDQDILQAQQASLLRDAPTAKENRDGVAMMPDQVVIPRSEFAPNQQVYLPSLGVNYELYSDDQEVRINVELADELVRYSVEQFGRSFESGSLPREWAECVISQAKSGVFRNQWNTLYVPENLPEGSCLVAGELVTPDSSCSAIGLHSSNGLSSQIIIPQRSYQDPKRHNQTFVHEVVHSLDDMMRGRWHHEAAPVRLDGKFCGDVKPAVAKEFCYDNLEVAPTKFTEFLAYEVAKHVKSHPFADQPIIINNPDDRHQTPITATLGN